MEGEVAEFATMHFISELLINIISLFLSLIYFTMFCTKTDCRLKFKIWQVPLCDPKGHRLCSCSACTLLTLFECQRKLEKAKHICPKGECSGAIRLKSSCLFLQKWERILATSDTVLHVAANNTGHRIPFFNIEHPSPAGLTCSWSQFLLEMEVKLDSISVLSLCFLPDFFKGNPSERAEPIWHCLLQWETRAL